MPEPLVGRPVLVADEVRGALLDALTPLWGGTLAGLQAAATKIAEPADVLLVVQLSPPIIQIIREAKPGRPAALLIAAPYGFLPDDGQALKDAVLAYIAGVLSGHVEDAAERAMLYARAVHGHGGFLLVVRPIDGSTRLFLAKADEDLSQALDLGGIGETVTSWN